MCVCVLVSVYSNLSFFISYPVIVLLTFFFKSLGSLKGSLKYTLLDNLIFRHILQNDSYNFKSLHAEMFILRQRLTLLSWQS